MVGGNLPSQWSFRDPFVSLPLTLYVKSRGLHSFSELIVRHRWQLNSRLHVLNELFKILFLKIAYKSLKKAAFSGNSLNLKGPRLRSGSEFDLFYLSISSTGFPCPPRIVRPRGQQWHPYRLNWRINSFGSFFWRNILIFIIRPMLRTLIPPACLSLKYFLNFWKLRTNFRVRGSMVISKLGFLGRVKISRSTHLEIQVTWHLNFENLKFWKKKWWIFLNVNCFD